MSEIEDMLERQARWQAERKNLSWAEKIRMAERVRTTAQILRAAAGQKIPGTSRHAEDESE